ncbi:MAG: hypothetical protein GXY03_00390 [Solirubrobacterales bacterium]|nr:hypothetical protein [Solirubrobacterales bacterium]
MTTGTTDPLAAGWAALAAADWETARDSFVAALVDGESGAALEGLGWSAWWLADEALTFDARERAFRAYRAEGDRGAAARVAAWLAIDHREFRSEASVGRGWLRRARAELDGLPDSADHGWVTLLEADFVLNEDTDVVTAERASLEAAAAGRRFGVPDLEAIGLAQAGIATVHQGRVAEGMDRLDEASVIAASEDLHLPVSAGWALCCLITACERVGDFARAAEWCGTLRRFAERWGGRQILGTCRAAYGRVLAVNGDWTAADAELTAAVGDLVASRPGMAAGGLVRLGEHRARQDRPDDARALFERAGPAGVVGLGELALAAGDARAAADAAERSLRALPEAVVLARLPAEELLARARAALGEPEAAAAALARAEAAVAALDTPYLHGRVRRLAAEVAAGAGDMEAARQAAEDAVDRFATGSAPYEEALARLELGRALVALGRADHARPELETARVGFARLGAERDVAAVDAALGETGSRSGTDAAGGSGGLSPRELEVLRLVAGGLSDAEIAERLVVSPHTVHRHVANIRAKLRQPSRAAAVAHAARAGLL